MTDPQPPAVQKLIDQWRASLARYDGGSHHLASDEAGMLSQCADELEAALTSSPSGAQDVIPSKPEQP